jgi:ribosomal protein S15P/S13E
MLARHVVCLGFPQQFMNLSKGKVAMQKNLRRLALLIACLFVFAGNLQAQAQNQLPADPLDNRIPRNSKVYIAPMDGFEHYLAAAFRKKSVPLLIVTDRDQADFEITGTHQTKEAGWAKTIFVSPAPSASASMQIVNLRTHVVVYADTSHRTSALRGERSTAEKLAKYLKRKMEKDERRSRS